MKNEELGRQKAQRQKKRSLSFSFFILNFSFFIALKAFP
jgi:hypothetical protein